MDKLMMQRRDAIKSLLAISAASALAACTGKTEGGEAKPAASASLKYASEGNFLNAYEMALVAALAQTIIPKTDTAGAIEAGVPAAIQGLASEWGDDNFRKYTRAGLLALDKYFKSVGGQAFADQSEKQRESLLSKYDADVFGGKVKDDFYRNFKSTVATAYYMSEPGASEELIYEAVPGDWKGCVPFSEIGRTWAT
ncbi:gluconate 2-dehydrogenase subunit 3 family protein [Hellea balneolensis]|uniref:gluconate 2-dehydrogenase subunit 3 family protein n=1 Tax=Hellea balneolensis TaxID=287478 RepID=UPI000478DD9D|nr:gluconate 2-dehydrogenase subunit 3 family protein [Hellea balneolensis]